MFQHKDKREGLPEGFFSAIFLSSVMMSNAKPKQYSQWDRNWFVVIRAADALEMEETCFCHEVLLAHLIM